MRQVWSLALMLCADRVMRPSVRGLPNEMKILHGEHGVFTFDESATPIPTSAAMSLMGPFATKPAGFACRLMSASLQKRPDCFAHAK